MIWKPNHYVWETHDIFVGKEKNKKNKARRWAHNSKNIKLICDR